MGIETYTYSGETTQDWDDNSTETLGWWQPIRSGDEKSIFTYTFFIVVVELGRKWLGVWYKGSGGRRTQFIRGSVPSVEWSNKEPFLLGLGQIFVRIHDKGTSSMKTQYEHRGKIVSTTVESIVWKIVMGKAAQKRSRCKALWGTPDADAMVDSQMAGRTRQNFSCSCHRVS
jgi:hypothetical protein